MPAPLESGDFLILGVTGEAHLAVLLFRGSLERDDLGDIPGV
jgi:hypothetical protein